MGKFISRIFNSFEVSENKNTILKKSKEKKLVDEINYYQNLPKELGLYFPRFVNQIITDEFSSLELEYYAYQDLGVKMVYSEFDPGFWKQLFKHIDTYFNDYRNYISDINTKEDSIKMFVEKTENEYNTLKKNYPFFYELTNQKSTIFNGKKLISFDIIWKPIKEKIMSSYVPENFNFFHGDLCFNNIIYGINKKTEDLIFKFIDPRGKFGETKFYGDLYYDLSKLSHSCSGGYEYFINDEFELNSNKNNNFELKFSNQNYSKINDIFLEYINQKNFNINKIKTIEGCIFISICTKHYDSINRQKAMYLTGLKILNDVYEKI